jgi:hypothetical protein
MPYKCVKKQKLVFRLKNAITSTLLILPVVPRSHRAAHYTGCTWRWTDRIPSLLGNCPSNRNTPEDILEATNLFNELKSFINAQKQKHECYLA